VSAYLFGLPPHIRTRYEKSLPFIADFPQILVEIGQNHLAWANHASAAECCAIAMAQSIDPLVQTSAAILVVDAFAYHDWKNAALLTRAIQILDERAAAGNPLAIEAVKKYIKWKPQ